MRKVLVLLWILSGSFYKMSAESGEELFRKNCASCHKITKERLVGPGLEGVTTRRSEIWLIKFIKNSQGFIKSGDADAIAIYEEYNKMLMPPFEHLSDSDIKAVIDYISQSAQVMESKKDIPIDTVQKTYEYSANDIERGRKLYTGDIRFINRGQPCISCHHVNNDEIIPGGLLAKDLTNAYSRLGHEGISGLLGSPPFPAMAISYNDNKLTSEEIFQLTAFLKHADEVSAMQKTRKGYGIMIIGGLCGLILLLSIIGISWKNRKKEMVKQDIFDRQLRGKDSVVY